MHLTARARPETNTFLFGLEPYFHLGVSVDCVIFGFDANELRVLLMKCNQPPFDGQWSLLGDLIGEKESLEAASYRILKVRTGLDNVYLEQFQSFGDLGRHPGGRVVTIAYYSLVNIRDHQLRLSDNELHWRPVNEIQSLAFDHKKILDHSLRHLQRKVQEAPIIFNLLGNKFSLRQLQSLYEVVLGVKVDRRNFRKKIFLTGLLLDTGEMEANVPHRPGKLYRFDHDKYRSACEDTNGLQLKI